MGVDVALLSSLATTLIAGPRRAQGGPPACNPDVRPPGLCASDGSPGAKPVGDADMFLPAASSPGRLSPAAIIPSRLPPSRLHEAACQRAIAQPACMPRPGMACRPGRTRRDWCLDVMAGDGCSARATTRRTGARCLWSYGYARSTGGQDYRRARLRDAPRISTPRLRPSRLRRANGSLDERDRRLWRRPGIRRPGRQWTGAAPIAADRAVSNAGPAAESLATEIITAMAPGCPTVCWAMCWAWSRLSRRRLRGGSLVRLRRRLHDAEARQHGPQPDRSRRLASPGRPCCRPNNLEFWQLQAGLPLHGGVSDRAGQQHRVHLLRPVQLHVASATVRSAGGNLFSSFSQFGLLPFGGFTEFDRANFQPDQLPVNVRQLRDQLAEPLDVAQLPLPGLVDARRAAFHPRREVPLCH